ncbi:putative fucose-1-phosphate guanylyltransferase-like [Apostichopus japonicus]|uniref:Putative fucose-1-phosphate guanylyltransferase-like n=1 Tax=Stichopus japonicus TaxID=307972 RepID=A0A2G8JRW3_STIJA|nr:putative fucose-1-phosphate guanylyltransferase-like [Apostichopus japonicus]
MLMSYPSHYISGKQADTFPFPFWDVVVISAADESQSVAFQQQINEKIQQGHLPLDVCFICFPDPGSDKIGPGGSLMAVCHMLHEAYGTKLKDLRVLFLPAGGFSQRLPSASVLGKIFTTLPLGNPIYQMLELQLAMYIDLPSRMTGGMFLACADTFILYDADDGSSWSFDKSGMTAFAHPSELEVGRNHGVFVVSQMDLNPSKVSMVECERFLHKVIPDVMRAEGAVLPESFNPSGDERILIDSSFFIDCETMDKLIDFYVKVQPLRFEIDSHGDFLQALGTKSNSAYISNMQNAVSQSQSLLKMRKDIFDVLRGTSLHALVLKESKFYHIGTTKEYLHHFCQNDVLQSELGLKQNVGNHYTGDMFNHSSDFCVMNSFLHSDVKISRNVVLEFCHFQGAVSIASNTIVSNCCFSNQSVLEAVEIPADTFLHTVCVRHQGKRQFVTVFFNVDDNLKKGQPHSSLGDLIFLGQRLGNALDKSFDIPTTIFDSDESTFSLWNAKLFQPRSTMDESFAHALSTIKSLRVGGHNSSNLKSLFENSLSMKDILKSKDIEGMLEFRRNLTASILKL